MNKKLKRNEFKVIYVYHSTERNNTPIEYKMTSVFANNDEGVCIVYKKSSKMPFPKNVKVNIPSSASSGHIVRVDFPCVDEFEYVIQESDVKRGYVMMMFI